MVVRPSGTVTFLFTDVEGSTRMWEDDADEMAVALELHDRILRSAIERHGGYVFSTAGDAFAAAFSGADAAVAAAVAAQRELGSARWPDGVEIRVRMGLHTGAAQERGGDYFGTPLNRAARVMAAGHGGQILLSQSTAGLCSDVELVDLGERRLKDVSGPVRLFQAHADGLRAEFAPLRAVDAVPGNLASRANSFVGRSREITEVAELVRSCRLVTLTGVGGVGKTSLAVEVAARLSDDHPDGVWLVELAGVGDPSSVPEAVASVLGIVAVADSTPTESVIDAMSSRRMLIVLDNCEHVLDAVAELAGAIVAETESVTALATSREGLGLPGERLWAVPTLDVSADLGSSAVQLFVDRARAVTADFELSDGAEVAAVVEICRRLDGIALAIELAAARMVSMSAQDVRDRLDDRFRLLSGARHGMERHQTLRQAVGWSYDLLDEQERLLLDRCAAFADGFDLAGATQVAGDGRGEYDVLDLLDALVRKSLAVAERVEGRVRYRLLETIRQYSVERLQATGSLEAVRDAHAAYYAERSVAWWSVWNGPDQRSALDWIDAEFANLRAGFRWAVDTGDLDGAAQIAAHTTMMGWYLLRYEPIGWVEELLPAATRADIAQLPRLHTAAARCGFIGRAEDAVRHAEEAIRLEADPRYDPFESGLSTYAAATAHRYAGRVDRWLDMCKHLSADASGPAQVLGACGLVYGTTGAAAERQAEAALAAARELGQPHLIAFALQGVVVVLTYVDPARALTVANEALDYCREHGLRYYEAILARNTAQLEVTHGDLQRGLELFEHALETFHQASNRSSIAATFARLTVLFERLGRSELAATCYGISTGGVGGEAAGLAQAVDRIRLDLGDSRFDEALTRGQMMTVGEAVDLALKQVRVARCDH